MHLEDVLESLHMIDAFDRGEAKDPKITSYPMPGFTASYLFAMLADTWVRVENDFCKYKNWV